VRIASAPEDIASAPEDIASAPEDSDETAPQPRGDVSDPVHGQGPATGGWGLY